MQTLYEEWFLEAFSHVSVYQPLQQIEEKEDWRRTTSVIWWSCHTRKSKNWAGSKKKNCHLRWRRSTYLNQIQDNYWISISFNKIFKVKPCGLIIRILSWYWKHKEESTKQNDHKKNNNNKIRKIRWHQLEKEFLKTYTLCQV